MAGRNAIPQDSGQRAGMTEPAAGQPPHPLILNLLKDEIVVDGTQFPKIRANGPE